MRRGGKSEVRLTDCISNLRFSPRDLQLYRSRGETVATFGREKPLTPEAERVMLKVFAIGFALKPVSVAVIRFPSQHQDALVQFGSARREKDRLPGLGLDSEIIFEIVLEAGRQMGGVNAAGDV